MVDLIKHNYDDERRLSISRDGVQISEKSGAIPVPQEMSPVFNEGCVVSTTGCQWCLGRVPLLNEGRLHCSHPYLDVVFL